MEIVLSPSILAADFNILGKQIKEVEEAGAQFLHYDVMDGVFVPSISFGLPVLESIMVFLYSYTLLEFSRFPSSAVISCLIWDSFSLNSLRSAIIISPFCFVLFLPSFSVKDPGNKKSHGNHYCHGTK